MVGIEAGQGFDPVSPDECDDGEKATQQREGGLEPETSPNVRLHRDLTLRSNSARQVGTIPSAPECYQAPQVSGPSVTGPSPSRQRPAVRAGSSRPRP